MPLSDEHAALIPEEIRSDPGLQSFNDVGSIAKSYLETKSMVGRSIQLPNGDGDLDKWAGETSAKLKDRGFTVSKISEQPPEKPEAYQFKVEGLTDEQVNGDKAIGLFRSIAHRAGLSNTKAQAILNDYLKEVAPALAAPAPEFIEAEGVKALMQKAFGKESEIAVSEFRAGVKQLAAEIPQLPDVLNEGVIEVDGKFVALGDHPAIVTLVREVAKLKSQDFGGNLAGLADGDTLESVQSEIDALRVQQTETTKQFELDKIGEKLDTLYKKKSALTMKRAS